MIRLLILLIIVLLAVIFAVRIIKRSGTKFPTIFDTPAKTAGRQGERVATNIIKSVLCDDDLLLNNVSISYDGKPAELDNVIVNKYGVFIIEVKNYKGIIKGRENDYEWEKYKNDGYGNTFVKTVKNPIPQVKRQIYILAKYLRNYGIDVWVEGYAMLIQGNSPVASDFILTSVDDIDHTVHTFGRNRLDKKTIDKIIKILD